MKARYKQTSIGEIPEDWEVESLSEVFKLSSGKSRPQEISEIPSDKTPYPVYGGNGILGYAKEYLLDTETIVIGRVGEYCGAVYKTSKFSWITDNALYAREMRRSLDLDFLTYLLTFLNLNRFKKKMGQPLLTQTIVYSIKIPRPPFPEQRRIAQILSCVDDAIRLVDETIAKTERLKKGLMHKLLTEGIGHKRFRYSKKLRCEIPEAWQLKTTKELFYIKGRIGWRGLKKAHYTEKGPYLITGWDFVNGKIDWKNCFHIPMDKFLESPEIIVQKNDVLLTKDGTIGKVAYIGNVPGGRASLSSHLLLIRNLKNDNVYPLFSYYLFQSKYFLDYVKRRQVGSTRAGLTQRAFEEFSFPLPSFEEQKNIASILSTIDSRLDLERKRKKTFERIKIGLTNDLLTGRRRVKAAM